MVKKRYFVELSYRTKWERVQQAFIIDISWKLVDVVNDNDIEDIKFHKIQIINWSAGKR